MPLPVPGSPWPPPFLADLLPQMQQWSAWYSGDIDQLTTAYGGTDIARRLNHPAQLSGGVRGALARILWGRPVADDMEDDRWHVPLASDLTAATAELCWSDPPHIEATSVAAQDRIAEYVEDGLLTTCSEGTELGAALGGHYLQAVLSKDHPRALCQSLDYDGAWPVFSRGKLMAVAFWWILDTTTSGKVWRHFESHELDPAGIGIIRHGLYLGSRDKIGDRQQLSARPETSYLVNPDLPLLAGDIWSTMTPGLDVAHIPGRTPQRLWRLHPLGKSLGRSVFQGVEGAFSKLDDAYSSWLRDVDLGRSRLVVADYLLDTRGPGLGASFDLDRKLITPLAIPRAMGAGAEIDPIRMIQFAIRVEEHRATCQELTEVVLRAASFSAQTFGEDEQGNAQTATGVLSKDSRSMRTRGSILNEERIGLQSIIRKMLAMDQAAGNGPVADDTVTVSFPEGTEESPLQLAQTVQALRVAEAASDETIVRMVHPDWADDQVTAEVVAIRGQAAAQATLDASLQPSFPPAASFGQPAMMNGQAAGAGITG
jgi:hypothetical protein